MNRKITLPIISAIAILALSASTTIVNSSGVANWTGSPVDGGLTQGTCAACHSGGSSTPTCSVTVSPAFGGSGNAKTYAPSTTYTITVTPGGSYARYGMNLELINSTSTVTATYPFGTFGAAITTNCQVYSTSQTGGYPACVSHKSTSTTTPFSFKWTSPASGTGYLYAVVLGANNTGNETGDKVSAVTAYTLTPATTGIDSHSSDLVSLNVFPNPATDNVRLTYTLAERSNVVVKLVNIDGEEVAALLNETQDHGPQAVDARLPLGIAKGMYMLKISINGKQTLQKLIVL
ncbi:MAG: choice-of-anchor V domain-containing protein [Bacteroidia bacterium]